MISRLQIFCPKVNYSLLRNRYLTAEDLDTFSTYQNICLRRLLSSLLECGADRISCCSKIGSDHRLKFLPLGVFAFAFPVTSDAPDYHHHYVERD